jgi:hypothetical protein
MQQNPTKDEFKMTQKNQEAKVGDGRGEACDIFIDCFRCGETKCLKDYYPSNQEQCKQCINRAHMDWVKRTPNAQLSSKLRSRIKTKKHCENLTGLPFDKFNEWLDFTKRYYVPKDYNGRLNIEHQYPSSNYDLTNEDNVAFCFNWKHLRYWTCEAIEKKEIVCQQV